MWEQLPDEPEDRLLATADLQLSQLADSSARHGAPRSLALPLQLAAPQRDETAGPASLLVFLSPATMQSDSDAGQQVDAADQADRKPASPVSGSGGRQLADKPADHAPVSPTAADSLQLGDDAARSSSPEAAQPRLPQAVPADTLNAASGQQEVLQQAPAVGPSAPVQVPAESPLAWQQMPHRPHWTCVHSPREPPAGFRCCLLVNGRLNCLMHSTAIGQAPKQCAAEECLGACRGQLMQLTLLVESLCLQPVATGRPAASGDVYVEYRHALLAGCMLQCSTGSQADCKPTPTKLTMASWSGLSAGTQQVRCPLMHGRHPLALRCASLPHPKLGSQRLHAQLALPSHTQLRLSNTKCKLTAAQCRLPGSSRVHASSRVEAADEQTLHSAWAEEPCAQAVSLHHCAVHQVTMALIPQLLSVCW